MASLRALSDDSHVVAAADHKNKNTWHHKNDFENVTLSSTRMTLDALDRFCHFARRLTQGPMIVVYSSLMWDIGRLMSADDRFRDIVSKSDPIAHLPVAWTHSLEPWLDAYEANLTRTAAAVQRQLRRFDSRAHGQHASHQTHAHAPASQLVLTGEFGCGMGLMHVCNHVVPLAASRVGRPAATLRVPFVDLHERITGDYILKEYAYKMHPSRQGSCARIWNAIANAVPEPSIPRQTHPYVCTFPAPTTRNGNVTRRQAIRAASPVVHEPSSSRCRGGHVPHRDAALQHG